MNIKSFDKILSIGETVTVEFKRCGNDIEGKVQMTMPAKPKSKNQKYIKS